MALCATGAQAQNAQASARTKARDLGYAGVEAYQKGDYQRANTQLAQAYELLPAPTLALWSARTLDKLGKLREAAERYRAATQLPVSSGDEGVQQRARDDAGRELEPLLERIPRVRFIPRGAALDEVQLVVDNEPLSAQSQQAEVALNPGSHRVVAVSGNRRLELVIPLVERERRDVSLNFVDVEANRERVTKVRTSRDTRATLGWVSLGVGGGGLVFGAVTGFWALGKRSALKDSGHCADTHCSSEERDSVSTYNTLRHLSTAGFVVGGVSAVTGLALLFVSKNSRAAGSSQTSPSFSLTVTNDGAELRGRF
ncbi:MAG TPA: hypothetical protein VG937_36850 [Polyangiaceae bacterium]|nr:hypothetical protein [Polyangiaceae bacterium]